MAGSQKREWMARQACHSGFIPPPPEEEECVSEGGSPWGSIIVIGVIILLSGASSLLRPLISARPRLPPAPALKEPPSQPLWEYDSGTRLVPPDTCLTPYTARGGRTVLLLAVAILYYRHRSLYSQYVLLVAR